MTENVSAPPEGAYVGAPADYPPSTLAGRGMFGVAGTGDTSGFGGLVRSRSVALDSPRPFGEYFDEVVDALEEAYLHVVYQLTSMTYRRRIRLECAVTAEDPHLPSVTSVYPTADWQEREAYDFFGVIFDGHPNLTRILMPDDWEGFPQRKDYPLGGVPVEYKGAEIPPPDERRSYQ